MSRWTMLQYWELEFKVFWTSNNITDIKEITFFNITFTIFFPFSKNDINFEG